MQPAFDHTNGVLATKVGYTGGHVANPSYEQLSGGTTGHVEAIEVSYNPQQVGYETLLQTYWENIDPTDADGQFADRGSQYHPAIFYADAAQQKAAEASKLEIAPKFAPKPILLTILPVKPFYPAEDYHQAYYKKNATHYNAYKYGSGRAGYLERLWGEHK
jgi:methionine-S-sulfoxide reductase